MKGEIKKGFREEKIKYIALFKDLVDKGRKCRSGILRKLNIDLLA